MTNSLYVHYAFITRSLNDSKHNPTNEVYPFLPNTNE